GEAVRAEDPDEGDAWVLNAPYRGGTHLPDITVVSPIHVAGELAGYAASRAHHADVGGRIPGSMPADSHRLDEEGVVLEPSRLVARGELDRRVLDRIVERMRGPSQRVADLRAQLAANRAGAARVAELAGRQGLDTVREAMSATLDYAERRTRAGIAKLGAGGREARDRLG